MHPNLRSVALFGWLSLLAFSPAKASQAENLWAYCIFEASGGVGTSIAMIVTQPFPVHPGTKAMQDIAVAMEYDSTEGIGNLIPGYHYFMSISGTDCRIRRSREEAQTDVEAWRNSTSYAIVRVVPWSPSAKHTGLKANGSAASGKANQARAAVKPESSVPPPAPVFDKQAQKEQAQARVAKLARSPEMIARSKDVQRRRAEVRRKASAPATSLKPAIASPAKPPAANGGPVEMFVFFINRDGKTVAFEGPRAMTRAEGNAMKARLAAEAPGRYGAGATVDARSRGGGWCAFVYQRPGEGLYLMGSETSLSTATNSMKSQVSNGKAVIHHDVVCPTNN